jgi:hypothetical protein
MDLKSNFTAGGPISQVPISWFTKVANFVKGFAIGVSPIKVTVPSNVSAMAPITIDFCPENAGADLDKIAKPSTAASSVPSGQSLKTTGWTRDSKGLGVRMMVITRIVRTGDYDNFFWAWGYFDRFGMLYQISKEQGCFSELTKEGWLSS